jgi:hypothetical protein
MQHLTRHWWWQIVEAIRDTVVCLKGWDWVHNIGHGRVELHGFNLLPDTADDAPT